MNCAMSRSLPSLPLVSELADAPQEQNERHEMKRDSEMWFDDGNIIVVAQRTGFRVHKSVLSRWSETFSGMFMLPQHMDSPDSSTGQPDRARDECPTVHITDTSHAFRQLLRAMYDGPE